MAKLAMTKDMVDLTTKQSLMLALQRAMEAQMVRLVEVWSANVGQVGEKEAWDKFALGLDKVAKARETMVKLIGIVDV